MNVLLNKRIVLEKSPLFLDFLTRFIGKRFGLPAFINGFEEIIHIRLDQTARDSFHDARKLRRRFHQFTNTLQGNI